LLILILINWHFQQTNSNSNKLEKLQISPISDFTSVYRFKQIEK